ncbi:hypothetical protein K438DRAFT_1704199 [Mycena galopus ATCC 62051]|nr:hypothetical protein K438DRAFT_1704199 [Mycena galopus ATCC 62051]
MGDGGEDAGAGAGNGRFSLAHELAVAMMPEPSAGSRLLADEFGIEFDEGAEGIDAPPGGPQINIHDGDAEREPPQQQQQRVPDSPLESQMFSGGDPAFASPTRAAPSSPQRQDAMEVLAADLASTDNFLSHLRRLDADVLPPSSSSQPTLERLASDVIRRINDTARDRESQVRELLEYEREFRRIGAEVGGQDVLGNLDALPVPEPEEEPAPVKMNSIAEDDRGEPERERRERREATRSPVARPKHARAFSQDWETDPDFDRLGDTDHAADGDADADNDIDPAYANLHNDEDVDSPPATAPALVGECLGRLSALRTHTSSLVASLTALSEHAQVNGAATADAGRKLRALRNRLGGWRTEWEGAERSRGRIERWERGEGAGHTHRVDGRTVVKEHLHAFEVALAEAGAKTQAIMAAS